MKNKISIQGNIGSFSHLAVKNLFSESNVELLERKSFNEVFEDLQKKNARLALIPIENSTYGSILTNYDSISKFKVKILAEIYLKIHFHLIGLPSAQFPDITEILVHPVALGQIQPFVMANSNIKVTDFHDTAGSVMEAKKLNQKNIAGIASKFASEIYDMKIIKKNIHENQKNYTRFYLVTLEENYFENITNPTFELANGEDMKTTVEFTLGISHGSLYKVLRSFADRQISLTKIESRPILNTEWEYRFYLDAVHKKGDINLQSSIAEIKEYTKEFENLGTYQVGKYINT